VGILKGTSPHREGKHEKDIPHPAVLKSFMGIVRSHAKHWFVARVQKITHPYFTKEHLNKKKQSRRNKIVGNKYQNNQSIIPRSKIMSTIVSVP
jgi:hypothetical protein